MQAEKGTENQQYGGPTQKMSTEVLLKTTPDTVSSREATLQSKIASLEAKIIELKSKNKQLELMSDRDGLTGVYNKRYLQKTAKKIIANELRSKRPWGVFMIDIDHFKKCNDEYGHQCGDEVLKNVAKMLQHISRDADFVIRYGGEEFCIIVFSIEESDLYDLAERYKKAIASTVTVWEGISISVTVSIGACFVPADSSMELEHVVAYADSSLYTAKDRGRNQVVVSDRRKTVRDRRK